MSFNSQQDSLNGETFFEGEARRNFGNLIIKLKRRFVWDEGMKFHGDSFYCPLALIDNKAERGFAFFVFTAELPR